MNRDRVTAIVMLLPSVILLGIFVYGFIAWTSFTSLTNSNLTQQLRGTPATNVGLKNYSDLFSGLLNSRFRIDMVNTVFFTIMFIIACLVVGITLAILLDQKVKGEAVFRTIFLFPMALSFVVTGVAWKWLFNPDSGINVLPTAIGLPAGTGRWFISEERILPFLWQDIGFIIAAVALGIGIFIFLWQWSKKRTQWAAFGAALALLMLAWITIGDPRSLTQIAAPNRPEQQGFNIALIAVVIAAGWQMSGYTMAMYLAGLRGISDDLREAGKVDGCGEWGIYRYIIFPLLQPITLSAIIILGHISLKIFDLVYTMGGGNNLFIDMPGINMFFTTFRASEFGRGAAIAVIMLLMVAVVIIPYLVSSFRAEAKK